jgi:hypothetical protein
LEEFDREWEKWLKSNPYAVLGYPDADDPTCRKFHVHRFDEEVKPENDIFGIVIGDYVHNLRSALDQLVWNLVTVANGKTPIEKEIPSISFPIVTSHPSVYWKRDMIARHDLTFEQALFLEGYQPYRTLNSPHGGPLANLNALWNADKHRLINPVFVRVAEQGPVFEPNADARIVETWWDGEIALKGDAKFACVRMEAVGPDPQVQVKELPVEVAFGEAERPIQNLPALLVMTSEIVENCARFFQ